LSRLAALRLSKFVLPNQLFTPLLFLLLLIDFRLFKIDFGRVEEVIAEKPLVMTLIDVLHGFDCVLEVSVLDNSNTAALY
jgi:hypothetical protein